MANVGKILSLVPLKLENYEEERLDFGHSLKTHLDTPLKKSGSSPSVRGPSALLSARPFSFRAPLLLIACQATCERVCFQAQTQDPSLQFIVCYPLP